MKKKFVSVLLMMMLVTALVACGSEGDRTSDEATSQEQEVTEDNVADSDAQNGDSESAAAELDSVSILADVWETYGENEKFYGMGGDVNNMVENAPGLYSLDDKEALASVLLVQADAAGMIDEAASLIHGMNTNVFTGAAFHVTDAANVQPFADAMKNSILNNQWMCGSPDRYVIYSLNNEYVVVAFGAVDVMDVFKDKFMTVHGDITEVLADENVAQ